MSDQDEEYAIPEGADADGVVVELEASPGAPEFLDPGEEKAPWRPGFFHRLSLHVVLVILLSGCALAALTAWAFRQTLFEQEYRAALTIFATVANDITAHIRTHGHTLETGQLDALLANHFADPYRDAPGPTHRPGHFPSSIVVRAEDGSVLYTYGEREPTGSLSQVARLEQPVPWYVPGLSEVQVAGRLRTEGAPTYLQVALPTDIGQRLNDLAGQTVAMALAVGLAAVALTLVFARRELRPLQLLTQAAHEVRGGDLSPRVPVRTRDEIGELSHLFNEMLGTLDRRISLMRSMQDAVVRIGRHLESGEMHETLLQAFCSMAGTRSGRLYICEKGAKAIEVRAEENPMDLPPAGDDRLATRAFEERWSQFVREDGRETGDTAQAAEMAIPLLSGTRRTGVIRLGRPARGRYYGQEAVDTLHMLAQFASVALTNADLYNLLGEQQRIEQEMLWARSIQQAMLPRTVPVLPGYEIYGRSNAASEVGGDYYDYVPGPDSDWHILIGDVSGKGVPAALIMSIVRSLMHTYLEFETSPREVLKRVNQSLSADLDPDMFVTLSSIRLDTARHTGVMARAGHEPALVLRASGEIEQFTPNGAALGLIAVSSFQGLIEEEEFQLGPGEALILYTDGITEARNAAGEDFGVERVCALLKRHATLPAKALHDALVAAVEQFSAGRAQQDDMTLIVLRRLETPA